MIERQLIVLSALEGYIRDCQCASRDDEDSYCETCIEVTDRILFLLGDN